MRKNGSEATVACSSSRSASSNMLNIGIASGHSVGEWDKAQNEVLKELEKIADLWPGGFACPTCGAPRGVVLNSRPRLFECLDCGRQTSITAGTAMHRSKLPLTVWFWPGFDTRACRQLSQTTLATSWTAARKLRAVFS